MEDPSFFGAITICAAHSVPSCSSPSCSTFISLYFSQLTRFWACPVPSIEHWTFISWTNFNMMFCTFYATWKSILYWFKLRYLLNKTLALCVESGPFLTFTFHSYPFLPHFSFQFFIDSQWVSADSLNPRSAQSSYQLSVWFPTQLEPIIIMHSEGSALIEICMWLWSTTDIFEHPLQKFGKNRFYRVRTRMVC